MCGIIFPPNSIEFSEKYSPPAAYPGSADILSASEKIASEARSAIEARAFGSILEVGGQDARARRIGRSSATTLFEMFQRTPKLADPDRISLFLFALWLQVDVGGFVDTSYGEGVIFHLELEHTYRGAPSV